MRRWMAVLAMLAGAGPAAGQPAIGGDPRVDPADFRVTTFVSGLDFPYGMVLLPDGSLLVATNVPDTTSLFVSSGELLRFVDADDDGVADGPGQVLASGLPGIVVSLARAGDRVLVSSSEAGAQGICVLRLGAAPADPLTLEGCLDFAFPSPWDHTHSAALSVVAVAGQPGVHHVYFNVGSQYNFASATDPVPVSGMTSGMVQGESLYRFTLVTTGPTATASALEQIATGLRNAFGTAVHPATGDLYLEDNGIDTPGNRGEAFSADEIDVIAAADLGGAVEDFGFPDGYVAYRTGTVVGGGIQPLATFQPIPPPDGAESEGASHIAFAPSRFPPGLDDGLFVGFHGVFSAAGVANEENPVVFLDLATGDYFHFVANTEPGVGHPNSLLSTSDSLFVADLSTVGFLDLPGNGVVHQIQVILPDCRDGRDDDRDGLVDMDDPGCNDPDDPSERSPLLPCDDGMDDDLDGGVDYSPWPGEGDLGCGSPTWSRENPGCSDGIDNDPGRADGIDFDGGASQNGGVPLDVADPDCTGPTDQRELTSSKRCGLGPEPALLLLGLAWARRRRVRPAPERGGGRFAEETVALEGS